MVLNFGSDLFQSGILGEADNAFLKSKVSFWGAAGAAFLPGVQGDTYTRTFTSITNDEVAAKVFSIEVTLPDKAVVIAVAVYGDGIMDWGFRRGVLDSDVSTVMASGSADSEDTSISNAIIDNSKYKYSISTTCNNTKKIHGAKITYTTD